MLQPWMSWLRVFRVLQVPNDPGLIGGVVHAQTVLVQFPLMSRLTNAISGRIVR